MRVRRGVEDYEPLLGKSGPQGLTRWKDSLNLIEEVYGRMSRLEVEMDGRAHEAPFGPAPELDVDEDLLQAWLAAQDREERA